MSHIVIQDIIFFIILIGAAVLLGNYIYKVMEGKKVFLTSILSPVEKYIYKLMDVSEDDEMDAKKYAISVLAFSAIGFLIVFLLQILQGGLILNPEGLSGTSWHLAFNTAASFVTNTNWQAYAGENTLSYLTQSLGLGVQNFVSAATGIAVLFAFIRGFIRKESKTIGNFWRDLVKTTLYVLIPLATVFSIILVSQGVVQSLDGYKEVVTVENKETQVIPIGPAASQIAIKQLGTNGGGFFGTNSAYPLENPTPLTNMLQVISILLIPTALCFTFGRAIKDKKQGKTLFRIMLVVFIVALIAITCSEQMLGSQWKGVALSGNMEGKEIRNGIGSSALWSTATTAASNGSVNSMHDSLTPLSGLVTMFLMQIGEVVFGGVGCGLYGIIAFVILTVFIGGLMVGRTPEYIGKKIEPFDMKMVCLVILVPPLLVLLGSAITVCMPQVNSWLSNSGPHGFTEILYNFSSVAGNNGSAFAGFNANTVYMNLISGVIMILARFIPMISIIYMAGNLAKKKSVAVSDGTLDTGKNSFVILVIGIIVLVGALSFLPALALGPIAEFFITI
ncbi:K+-transporting ATPase ATPase A chain [Clostridium collagenovorans DSM 3089]|uniref:Potassium-transporting ATPase potassium-binding subunit n=1 Tax=Clostridium collagenovorans DSM 3089 TaxID=1121306 RepID=A0A1M5XHU6_9CLOT|nr:potassium-transporting ATPase subunit KdpA [Clostridium collagenovorans]SHH99319.1 K+-transporting ATPase ATPase A chain [Clostridium collagenovorans DSM 3089]